MTTAAGANEHGACQSCSWPLGTNFNVCNVCAGFKARLNQLALPNDPGPYVHLRESDFRITRRETSREAALFHLKALFGSQKVTFKADVQLTREFYEIAVLPTLADGGAKQMMERLIDQREAAELGILFE